LHADLRSPGRVIRTSLPLPRCPRRCLGSRLRHAQTCIPSPDGYMLLRTWALLSLCERLRAQKVASQSSQSCFVDVASHKGWQHTYKRLNEGAWLPATHEQWYQRLIDAETNCSYRTFFRANHDGKWPTSNGADQRLFYAPKGCQLAPFDAAVLLTSLRQSNMSLLLIGDSLMEHVFMWMQCQVEVTTPILCTGEFNRRPHFIPVSFPEHASCQLPNSSSRIMFTRAQTMQSIPLQALIQKHALSQRDAIIMSTGVAYSNPIQPTSDLQRILQQVRPDWPRLFWREPLPQHWPINFDGAAWDQAQRCNNATIMRESNPLLTTQIRDNVLKALGSNDSLVILNTHGPALARADEHPALHFWHKRTDFTKADCTHYLPCSSTNRFVGTVMFNAIHAHSQQLASLDKSIHLTGETTHHRHFKSSNVPTGTTASAVIAKMVTDGIPGHGVDWTSSVGDSVTDHRNLGSHWQLWLP
jgi:hypothetical protein